jgi:O-antigen/teichoic acid export membrane protein
MIFKNNKLIKILSLNSISVGVQFVLSLLSVKIIASILGPSGMAIMGNFRSFVTLSKSLCVLGLKEGLIKLIIENKEVKQKEKEILNTFFVFFITISLLVMTFILLFSRGISNYLFQTTIYFTYINYFALLLPFFVIQTILLALLNAQRKFSMIVVIQILINVLLFITSVFFIYQAKLKGAFLAISVSDFISLMVVVPFVYKKVNFSFYLNKVYLKPISKYILMATVSAIIVPVTSIFIRNYIIDNAGLNAAGLWEAVNRISGFYMMFFNAGIAFYYIPKLAEITTDKGFFEELKKYFKFLVSSFMVVLILVYLFKEFIISIALTPNFNPINKILIWQLIGDFFRFSALAFGYQILVKAMVVKYVFIEIFYNICFLIISFFLFQEYKVEGVLIAYAIANFIILVIMFIIFRKLFKKEL